MPFFQEHTHQYISFTRKAVQELVAGLIQFRCPHVFTEKRIHTQRKIQQKEWYDHEPNAKMLANARIWIAWARLPPSPPHVEAWWPHSGISSLLSAWPHFLGAQQETRGAWNAEVLRAEVYWACAFSGERYGNAAHRKLPDLSHAALTTCCYLDIFVLSFPVLQCNRETKAWKEINIFYVRCDALKWDPRSEHRVEEDKNQKG